MDKNQAIIDYLITCPKIQDNPLYFNFIHGNEDDKQILSDLNPRNTIIAVNKTDISDMDFDEKTIPEEFRKNIVYISAKNRDGLDSLSERIRDFTMSKDVDFSVDFLVTNLRHTALLKDSLVSLQNVDKSINDGMPEDFFTVDLMDAYRYLGLIIGEDIEDDLVETIFSQFCMGK